MCDLHFEVSSMVEYGTSTPEPMSNPGCCRTTIVMSMMLLQLAKKYFILKQKQIIFSKPTNYNKLEVKTTLSIKAKK